MQEFWHYRSSLAGLAAMEQGAYTGKEKVAESGKLRYSVKCGTIKTESGWFWQGHKASSMPVGTKK